jgi:GNAT superfamily N-acetyltransferase
VQATLWAIWRADAAEIVATTAFWTYPHFKDNQHLAQFSIAVRPDMRRQGLAKLLLPRVAGLAGRENRRLMITETDSLVPAGEAYMKRLGAKMGIEVQFIQLDLGDLDRALLTRWQELARERAGDFRLELWDGPYPEEDIQAVVDMKKVMNTAPRDELDVEDREWTVEELRQGEKSMAEQNYERWTMVARHRQTAEIAGYTQVYWKANNPELLDQGDTAVFPKFRNRGMGRWLKAAMLEKALRDRPGLKQVRTDNAGSNAPMLKINQELGFKPYKVVRVWQMAVAGVEAYLAPLRLAC